jgi:hypothetical protein
VLLDQVLDLSAGAVDRFINVFGIAALQRGDDVADIDASAQHVIGVAGAGLDPGHHPPLLVPRLGRVARLGKAAQNRSLVHGTAHPDIVGGSFDQAVEHNIAGTNRALIATLAQDMRLVTIAVVRDYVEAGILSSYGPNYIALFRRTAEYVDKILRGTKPGDIPVEQPIKFDLVINLKTAKALGIEVPAKILAVADEVIE